MKRAAPALLLLAWAIALRVVFFSGFVLCDDILEFSTSQHVLAHGPALADQFQLRFGGWLFNVPVLALLGVSELAFFLPSVLMSASLAVLAYAILVRWGYSDAGAFAAGLMVAAAPFEVLIGTVRANDLFLAWLVACAAWALVALGARPVLQGILVALFGWLAFYVKLWVIYLLPALGAYYLLDVVRRRRWRGAVAFAVASLALHAATCAVWKWLLDDWVPFVHVYAATYPVARQDLPQLWRTYPDLLLRGSEFGTTLFGSVPYLVAVGLVVKLVAGVLPGRRAAGWRLDARDWALFGWWGSFFLLLEFFPNSFSFDRYYSAPRIFRYLAPVSFPLTLQLAKLVLDAAPRRAPWVASMALVALCAWNVRETAAATAPSRAYREAIHLAADEIRARRPPLFVSERWLSYFFARIYLAGTAPGTQIIGVQGANAAREYEAWLDREQSRLPQGTVLLTGLGSCVHYGAYRDGFRLALFQHPLDPGWQMVKDLGVLAHQPAAEPARLWELRGSVAAPPASAVVHVDPTLSADEIFRAGMSHFDAERYAEASAHFDAVLSRAVPDALAQNALYFRTICDFRAQRWDETIAGFERLLGRFPDGPLTSAAWYHIGMAYRALRNDARARTAFLIARDRGARDATVAGMARDRLAEMDVEAGLLERLARRLGLRA